MQRSGVYRILPKRVWEIIAARNFENNNIQEIRIRTGKPLCVIYDNREYFMPGKNRPYMVTYEDIREMLSYISNYSLYAYEEEMKQGFITIEGGHRIGLCGQAIVESGKVKNIKYISSINVRMAHEVIGCADGILPYLINGRTLFHTLIISPPRCGKTTLLRDLIRQISDGSQKMNGKTVGVVDERSEIGGCYRGVAQNQLGMRTDILDGCPKAEGMLMLIRSMGPEVIAVDEIGTEEDVHAIDYAMHCGCKMLATVHGTSLEEIKEKPVLGRLVEEERFQRYIVLGNRRGVGSVEGIYDENGRCLSDCRNDNACRCRKGERISETITSDEAITENTLSDTK